MPAKNTNHDAVVAALRADGWTITHDPLFLAIGRRRLFVDLAAVRAVAAERGGERIAVEVQSFSGGSQVEKLHAAVGQFVVYRVVLDHLDPGRTLYLAVTDEVHAGIFTDLLGRMVVEDLAIKFLVFAPEDERVTQWID